MKKIKVGISVLILFVLCFVLKKIDLLFSYVLALFLHEMAHLFVATRCGYNLKMFRFDLLGMSVDLDAEIDHRDSFVINIAGPVFNLLLALVCCAMYWLFPISYMYLNLFCLSNISLAVFNLLPIYPLDGGKIFRGIFKSDKVYKKVDKIIRILLCGVFLILFLFSLSGEINCFFLMMSVFFITSKAESNPTFSLFKSKSNKRLDKVVILKAEAESNLYDLIRLIKKSHYTIFYFNLNEAKKSNFKISSFELARLESTKFQDQLSAQIFIDEEQVINLSLNFPLTTKIKEIV